MKHNALFLPKLLTVSGASLPSAPQEFLARGKFPVSHFHTRNSVAEGAGEVLTNLFSADLWVQTSLQQGRGFPWRWKRGRSLSRAPPAPDVILWALAFVSIPAVLPPPDEQGEE